MVCHSRTSKSVPGFPNTIRIKLTKTTRTIGTKSSEKWFVDVLIFIHLRLVKCEVNTNYIKQVEKGLKT